MASPTAIRTQGVIRRAAIELAIEKPVDDVTVDDIAERAGVSRRTVFNHFPSKYDVYLPSLVSYPQEALDALATLIRDLLEARWRATNVDFDDLCILMKIGRESSELRMAFKEAVEGQRAALVAASARRVGKSEDSLEVLALVGTVQAIERCAVQSVVARPGGSSAEVADTFDRVVDVWARLSAELSADMSSTKP